MSALVLVDADNLARWRGFGRDWQADPASADLCGTPAVPFNLSGTMVVAFATSTVRGPLRTARGGVDGWLERLLDGFFVKGKGRLEVALVPSVPQAADAALVRLMRTAPRATERYTSVWMVSDDNDLKALVRGRRKQRCERVLFGNAPHDRRGPGTEVPNQWLGPYPARSVAGMEAAFAVDPSLATLLSVTGCSVRGVDRMARRGALEMQEVSPKTFCERLDRPPGLPPNPGALRASNALGGVVRLGDVPHWSVLDVELLEQVYPQGARLPAQGANIDDHRVLGATWPPLTRPLVDVGFRGRAGSGVAGFVRKEGQDEPVRIGWVSRGRRRCIPRSEMVSALPYGCLDTIDQIVQAVPQPSRHGLDLVAHPAAATATVAQDLPAGHIGRAGAFAVFARTALQAGSIVSLVRIQTASISNLPAGLDRLPLMVVSGSAGPVVP